MRMMPNHAENLTIYIDRCDESTGACYIEFCPHQSAHNRLRCPMAAYCAAEQDGNAAWANERPCNRDFWGQDGHAAWEQWCEDNLKPA